MNARTLAVLLTAGRALFGIAMLIAPRRIAGAWIGDDVDRPGPQLLVRVVGARDLVLGAGGAVAVIRGENATNWVTMARCPDVLDAALTLASFRDLPAIRDGCSTMGLALGSASPASSFWRRSIRTGRGGADAAVVREASETMV